MTGRGENGAAVMSSFAVRAARVARTTREPKATIFVENELHARTVKHRGGGSL